jgi:hypothetical protein
MKEDFKKVIIQITNELNNKVSPFFIEIIQNLLDIEPKKRFTSKELYLKLKNINFDYLDLYLKDLNLLISDVKLNFYKYNKNNLECILELEKFFNNINNNSTKFLGI